MDANQLKVGQRVWLLSSDNRIVEGPITALSAFATGGLSWVTVSGLVHDSGESYEAVATSYNVFDSLLDAVRRLHERQLAIAENTARMIAVMEKEAA